MMARQQQGGLWWKIATVLAVLGSFLIGALAYNLGSIHQGSKNQQIAESETMINNVLRKKMDMCNDQLKSKVDNERWIQELQEEEKLISAETTILTETLDYHRDATESCEFEITAKQEDRHVISDQQVLINKLEFENTMMELNFNNVTTKKSDTRAMHRLFIRAIRLENELLRRESKKKAAEEAALQTAEQEREDRRKRLQEEDKGLGEVDDHTENEKLSNLQKSLNSLKASDIDRNSEKQFEDEDPDEWRDEAPPPSRKSSEKTEEVQAGEEEPPKRKPRRRKKKPAGEEVEVVAEEAPKRRRKKPVSEEVEAVEEEAPKRRRKKPVSEDETVEEEAPKRRKRRRRQEPQGEEEAPPPRRRRAVPAEDAEEPRRPKTESTNEEGEDAPRPRRRRRKKEE